MEYKGIFGIQFTTTNPNNSLQP